MWYIVDLFHKAHTWHAKEEFAFVEILPDSNISTFSATSSLGWFELSSLGKRGSKFPVTKRTWSFVPWRWWQISSPTCCLLCYTPQMFVQFLIRLCLICFNLELQTEKIPAVKIGTRPRETEYILPKFTQISSVLSQGCVWCSEWITEKICENLTRDWHQLTNAVPCNFKDNCPGRDWWGIE